MDSSLASVRRPLIAADSLPLVNVAMTAAWRVYGALLRYRGPVIVLAYLFLTAFAHLTALWLQFDGLIPSSVLVTAVRVVPLLLLFTLIAFLAFGLHRSVWRFTGIWDLRDLVLASIVTSLATYSVVRIYLLDTSYPRSAVVMATLLSICSIGGARLTWRILLELRPGQKRRRRILIYGAGDAGEMIVRDLNKSLYSAIGFIDDDPAKVGKTIHKVRVLGSRDDLARIVTTESPDELLVAMPSAGASSMRRILSAVEAFKIPITTLPPLHEIVEGKVSITQKRQLSPRDLLPRNEVQLDLSPARNLIEGRRVLVTGAGGSIGSELCAQILALGPAEICLYERYENNLYEVLNKLGARPSVKAMIGDVTDLPRLHAVMRHLQPHAVFHAAAHKHVPLMEMNPCEAVKNNVIGTRRVAEAAIRYGAERFVLISTDKAVNPSSLMGATKRVAELTVMSLAATAATRMATVRFGNVLGSNGSVIPRWQEQIADGGPVTVTHAEMRRYFMLIPEAVQLILQAAAVMDGREIFVLEMGEQIKLLDMARNLIRLSGYVPEEEIPISIVGTRPGEKLHEELVGPDEVIEASPVEKVLRLGTLRSPDPGALLGAVTALGQHALRGNAQAVVEALCQIVPTFQPGDELCAQAQETAAARQNRRPLIAPRRTRISAPRPQVAV
jgi:FlaA1/EpsC-like NDP-sugar epimerase